MASVRSMGKGWQAEVRRYGHKVYRTFPTREEAGRYAEAIEEEMLRAQQLADAFNNRYSAFVVVWQFAYRELRQMNYGDEPSNEEIANHIAKDTRLLKIAGMSHVRLDETPEHEAASWDTIGILEHFARLDEQREAIEQTVELIDRGGDDAAD